MKKEFLYAIGAGLVAGFFLANAKSGSGIYATPVGKTLSKVYMAGVSQGMTPATASTAPAVNTAVV